jgi:hypothetical protein
VEDRGHIRFAEPGTVEKAEGHDWPSLWLYTHWFGTQLPAYAADMLDAARERWGDPSYGTRLAVGRAFELFSSRLLGWGLSATADDMGDGGRYVEIDMRACTVRLVRDCGYVRTPPIPFDVFVRDVPGWDDMDRLIAAGDR